MTLPVDELIERLEKLTGPDRETDAAIHVAAKRCDPQATYYPEGNCVSWYEHHPEVPGGAAEFLTDELPTYTRSIDAALTLVPEGAWLELNGPRKYLGIPTPVPNHWRAHINFRHIAWAATPAIALCIAALKARGTKE